MKCNIYCLFLLFMAFWISSFAYPVYAQQNSHLKLWYDEPAEKWVEALPLGNGRLGAMVYGDPEEEIIQLNENTVWAGQPNRNDNPGAKEYLPKVRELLFEGKSREAQELVNQHFISKRSHGMAYQTVGNLKLSFQNHENYSEYYRELDIEKAVTTTRYKVGEVNFETKVFASYPDQVIVMEIKADKSGALNFTAKMDRPEGADISTSENGELILSGKTTDFEGGESGAKPGIIDLTNQSFTDYSNDEAFGLVTVFGNTIYEDENYLNLVSSSNLDLYLGILKTNFETNENSIVEIKSTTMNRNLVILDTTN